MVGHFSQFATLNHFMDAYYNQNYDLVFGDLKRAVEAFKNSEPHKVIDLALDIRRAIHQDEFIDTSSVNQRYYERWKGMGGMILFKEDAKRIVILLEL